MTLTLLTAEPLVWSREGGQVLSLRGVFAPGRAVRVSLQAAGQTVQMTSGNAGTAETLVPMGALVTAIFPHAPAGATTPSTWRLVVDSPQTGETATFAEEVTLVEPFFSTLTYSLRQFYDPIWATGPREIQAEAYPWA